MITEKEMAACKAAVEAYRRCAELGFSIGNCEADICIHNTGRFFEVAEGTRIRRRSCGMDGLEFVKEGVKFYTLAYDYEMPDLLRAWAEAMEKWAEEKERAEATAVQTDEEQ